MSAEPDRGPGEITTTEQAAALDEFTADAEAEESVPTLTDTEIIRLRHALRRHRAGGPRNFGPRGVAFALYNSAGQTTGSVIVSLAPHPDGVIWRHASIARTNGIPPSYDDLAALKAGAFGPDAYAYQVFPPADQHVNIHPGALHLWGRHDGLPVLPEFGAAGTI